MTHLVSKFASLLVAASIALVPASPAMARHHGYDRNYGYGQNEYDQNQGYYQNHGYDQYRYDERDDNDRRYDRPYRSYRDDRCNRGTGGLIIGAIVGGLAGRAVVGRRGDRTAGAIIGAGAGALAGRAIDRSDRRRC